MTKSSDSSTPDNYRSAWVQPALNWSAVMKVRARIDGPVEQAPSHIGDIELHPLSRQLLAWWLEARGTRVMPAPDDVSPRTLVELLPYMRLLHWEGEERLVFRIYGSALAEATGFDLTGYNSIGEGDYAGKAEDVARLQLMRRVPCGLVLHRELTRPDGSTYLCEFINLPISAGEDGKDRIIGTIVPCEKVSEAKLGFELKAPLTVRRAAFIDIGQGLPEAAERLSV